MDKGSRSGSGTVLLYGRSGDLRIEASFERGFEALGWRVERFEADPDAGGLSWWLQSRPGRRLSRRSGMLRRWGSRSRNRRLEAAVEELRPDLVFLVNGAFVMPETVERISREGTPVAVFHPDAPVCGNGNHRPEHIPAAREADACFVWSRTLRAQLEREGVENAYYLPFAWDPQVFPHVGAGEGAAESTVVFIGGWDRHREKWLEPVAERFDLRIWGPAYWSRRTRPGSPLRRCWQGSALRGRAAAKVLSNAAISLNILREQNLPDGTNMRTFEIPGAGGFQLATRTSGATKIFPEGEAGAYFGSVEEMLEKIDDYLERPAERQRMARCAHSTTEAEHRYLHRVDRILSIVGGQ